MKHLLLLSLLFVSCAPVVKTKIVEEKLPVINRKQQRYDILNVPYDIGMRVDFECKVKHVDSDLALSLLLSENQCYSKTTIHYNSNGTRDIGLFQINEKTWEDRTRNSEIEYDIYDYRDNIRIAISHIQWISETLEKDNMNTFDNVVCAYNCGIGRVWRNNVPKVTLEYLRKTKMNYAKLRNVSTPVLRR